VDVEVVDWFKFKGSGYQMRISRILRRVKPLQKNARTGPTALEREKTERERMGSFPFRIGVPFL
jgi:hypothetical protein